MTKGRVLLEDEFEYQTVPFIVKVETVEKFVNAKTGEITSVSFDRTPPGYDRTPREWVICELVIGRVRPDYPFTIEKEWSDNVDKHFHTVVALDAPERVWKWKVFPTYEANRVREVDEVDSQAIAEKTIAKMKDAYENRDEVEDLEASV